MRHHITEHKEAEKAYAVLKEKYHRTLHPEYHSVHTVDEAIDLLEKYKNNARIFAGGLDILGQLKSEIVSPGALINIKPIEKLKLVFSDAGGISIGSLLKIHDIENAPLIKKDFPMLADAAAAIGSPHIRRMATLAGNLCQQTRCWYYRRSPDTGITFNCRRKTESGPCYAIDGENQYHAVADYTHCVSACLSDMAVALAAMGAHVSITSGAGIRRLSIGELYSELGLQLKPNEIITTVNIPKPKQGTRQKFLKFRIRKAIDFAIVSAAVSIRSEKEEIKEAKIYLGGVSHQPYQALAAENAIAGKQLTEAVAQHAGEMAISEMKPLSKNAYKLPIVKALIKRALLEL